ncbi:MAG: winged helix-turn-helix domain-containing protein [Chloroflexi bacterium]|nr:winged helix-turn-helix domain-containing protein [Chloroflexota bacterium]
MNHFESGQAGQAGGLLIVGQSVFSDEISQRVSARGFMAERATSARDAVARVSQGDIYVVMLDLASSQVTMELADTLQGLPGCPPIVVLDSVPTIDRVVDALRIGVVDYLCVADNEVEVIDRLTGHLMKGQATHMRLAQPRRELIVHKDMNSAVGLPGLELNAARRMLVIEDMPILLSSIELSLIEALIQRTPNLVSYERMASIAFPTTRDVNHALRLLRPHIARLRRKFESVHNTRWRISNFRGQGYVLQRIGLPVSVASDIVAS